VSGRLALVATPIGNLSDLSERAAACLREADCVLAEDTRRARKLLRHLGVAGKRVERLDAAMEAREIGRRLEQLRRGAVLALVSDAGTPTVSDPGAELVRAAAAEGIEVTPLPGPSAVTAALAASGMPASRFRFFGFLPRRAAARRSILRQIVETEETAVLFEAPTRMASTLAELARWMPEREAVLAREMTKLYEEFLRGHLAELAAAHAERAWKGELVVVLGPWQAADRAEPVSEQALEARIDELLAQGMRAKDAAKALSLETGLPAADLYRRISRRRS